MEAVTAWKAQDGKLFLSKMEAAGYEFGLRWEALLSEFLGSPANQYSGAQATIVRKAILAWETFKTLAAEKAVKEVMPETQDTPSVATAAVPFMPFSASKPELQQAIEILEDQLTELTVEPPFMAGLSAEEIEEEIKGGRKLIYTGL